MTTTSQSLVQIDEQQLVFHLKNRQISYIIHVLPQIGQLENLYFGPAITMPPDFHQLIEREIRPSNNQITGDYTSSLEHIRQEYPCFGTTDFRQGAYAIQYPAGDYITEFRYQGYSVSTGYPDLGELPHARYDDEQATTLTVQLQDAHSGLEMQLHYTISQDSRIIIRSTTFYNHSATDTYQLRQALSLNLDLPDADYDLLHLHGAWAKEMQLERQPLMTGRLAIDSDRGASSHQHNPFLALATKNATEEQGRVYGATLLYSGNFLGQVEVDNYHVTRLSLGISPTQFDWVLQPGGEFQTPQAVLTCSTSGLTGMSQEFQRFFRQHVIDRRWADQPKPLLINNWEATYFDFDEAKLLKIATQAKKLDLDLFVLDDGWFGHRDSDDSSLGDWTVDRHKLPQGLPHLVHAINQLGLQFGLWFEPEMVSLDTPLAQKHPDWIVGSPTKRRSHGRNQYVLDFSNPQVVQAIFEQMAAILNSAPIAYIKWDMNRYISEAFSSYLDAAHQGEFYHRYILGVYHLYHELLAAFPDLLIESCAGGGGRFDGGMLYYASQAWTSDDTDAVERLKIQYGASLLYPLQSMGAHVSAIPNQQVGRLTPLSMRADVALFGTFGYELDVTKLDDAQLTEMKAQIKLAKKMQSLIQTGDFYRLQSPLTSNQPAWEVYQPASGRGLIAYYQILSPANPGYQRLRLRGLNPAQRYQLQELDPQTKQVRREQTVYGDQLLNMGIILSEDYTDRAADYWQRPAPHDFMSRLFYLYPAVDQA